MAGSHPDTKRHADALRQAWATVAIDRLETLYTLTGQGEHVWRAYRVARYWRVPLPAWVLAYLDACAKPLAAGPSSAAEALRVLHLASTGRGGRRTRRADTADKHLSIVQHVAIELKRQRRAGPNLDTFLAVAERVGISDSRVRTIWYAWTVRKS